MPHRREVHLLLIVPLLGLAHGLLRRLRFILGLVRLGLRLLLRLAATLFTFAFALVALLLVPRLVPTLVRTLVGPVETAATHVTVSVGNRLLGFVAAFPRLLGEITFPFSVRKIIFLPVKFKDGLSLQ